MDWLATFKDELLQMEHLQPEQISVRVEPERLQVFTDPGHLHQVLTNLCQNAIRHGGNPAELRLRARIDDNEGVQIEVADNGSGIEPETVEQMFEPFYTTASSGTGLGLYIARELCESNQARLSYQPESDGGSCFCLNFPMQSSKNLK